MFWIGNQNNIVRSVREELKTFFYLICKWLQVYLQLLIKESTVLVLYWKWVHSESHRLDSTESQQTDIFSSGEMYSKTYQKKDKINYPNFPARLH